MAPISCSRKEFKPTDDELIQLFLYNKANGKPLPTNVSILEYDLYGEKNPWEIWEAFGSSNSYGGTDLYFLTTLKKKFSTGSRSVRTIGCGLWEAEDSGKDIIASSTMQCIGTRRRLRFEKSGTIHDGAWILHEYSIDSSLLDNPSANNYVLCRFRKNLRHDLHKKQGGKRTRQEDITVTQPRKRVVLGLKASTVYVDKNVGSVEDIHHEPRNQVECGDKRMKEVEISNSTEFVYKKQEDDDLTTTWPQLITLQMREANGVLVQEVDKNVGSVEDIHHEPRNQVEFGDKRMKEVEISNSTEFVYKKQEDDDLTTTWPQLITLQMREANGVLVQEVDRNVSSVEDIHHEQKNQVDCGDKRMKEVEISNRTEFVYKEQVDDDLTMTWPELFLMQMRESNGVLVQEEEIQMFPNTFYHELLLERLPPFYI